MSFTDPSPTDPATPRRPTLSDYRDKLTPGRSLGLAYRYFDSAYQATRGTHPTPHTVVAASDEGVTFARQGHAHPPLPWHTELTYLNFGPGPYTAESNALRPF